jgi:iron complex transport system substrate-binding protein
VELGAARWQQGLRPGKDFDGDMIRDGPNRIVCLSVEVADWLARIGAWDRVAGVTAYYRVPEQLPLKPRVSGFSSANLEAILRLRPDLVILFSDVQADLAAQLVRRGCAVLVTNPRSLREVEETLGMLSRLVLKGVEGLHWLEEFRRRMQPCPPLPRPVRVYFEEWDEPLISGIAWISEMIERAGGQDIFAALRDRPRAADRVVRPEQVRAADPDLILASWCGKPTVVEQILARPGWESISAVRRRAVYAVDPEGFLQPGYRLVEGYAVLRRLLEQTAHG